MRLFDELHITREREQHIWERHKITPGEVLEAFEGVALKRGPRSRDGGRTYIGLGRTYAGRRVWILIKPDSRRGRVAKLITARQDD